MDGEGRWNPGSDWSVPPPPPLAAVRLAVLQLGCIVVLGGGRFLMSEVPIHTAGY